MDKHEMQAFAEAISTAYLLTGAERPPKELLRAFWSALEGYPLVTVQNAIQGHLQDPERGRFKPVLSDILAKIVDTAAPLKAWTKAIDAAQSVGCYADVVFDDPAIMVTIRDMGGWIEFCKMPEEQQKFAMHEFTKRYTSAARNREMPETQLGGLVNADRSVRGLPLKSPVPVGDRTRCASLLGHIEERKAISQKMSVALPSLAIGDQS